MELLVAVAIAAILALSMGAIVSRALEARAEAQARNTLNREAQFALERMLAAVRAGRLLLPLPENPSTGHSEAVRDVLAVSLDPTLDRDGDGFADANNDRDFFDADGDTVKDPGERERVNEDPGRDNNKDGCPGICGVDDDGDGLVDEGSSRDDDEDGLDDEDPRDASDNDGDGAVDEDTDGDTNADGQPGVAGVDDDEDGATDEGNSDDDDEDGATDEDWLDVVVYRLDGDALVERSPNLGAADGSDYSERVIAAGVTLFQVERLPRAPGERATRVDITLELTDAEARVVNLQTRVRSGGGP
ncbi:MAG: hypothetical protein GWN84_17110 [Gammaproteobacteria bacterium]|nr:hypothetical protein [Gammaproteobacteria bacterium]NIR84557.1 hypothetical protein [Gammaproteobacteria bacterium]